MAAKRSRKSSKGSTSKKKAKTSKAAQKQQKPPLDVLFVHRQLQEKYKKKVDPTASFVLEGVLQYLGAEIMEMSYRVALNRQAESGKPASQVVTITAQDIKTAVEADKEMQYLIRTEKKDDGPKTKNIKKEK